MITPTLDIREFEKNVDNIYHAVMITAKRARKIHAKENDELKRQLGEVENEEDLDEAKVDREEIAKSFDKRPKPNMIAVQEFLDGKLKPIYETGSGE